MNRNMRSDVYFGLNFNESAIFAIIRDISISPNTLVYLTDECGVVISAKDKSSIGMPLEQVQVAGLFSGNGGAAEVVDRVIVDGERFQRIVVANAITGRNIVAFVPEKSCWPSAAVCGCLLCSRCSSCCPAFCSSLTAPS